MKRLKVLVLAIIMLISMGRIVCAEDAYMGFSVSDGWYVFSRDMKDTEFLKSLDLTTAEVNEILDNSGCRYLLSNPAKDCEIYVKVSENDLSYDLYNLAEQTNEHLMENLRKILYDGFTMKGLNYNDAGVVISDYPQMKFVTVPGSTFYDDKKHDLTLCVMNRNKVSRFLASLSKLNCACAIQCIINIIFEIVRTFFDPKV